MDMPAIEIMVPGAAIAAIAAASYRIFTGQTVRLASTSQELLDLFEVSAPPPSVEPVLGARSAAALSTDSACGTSRHRKDPDSVQIVSNRRMPV
jgi:hypothetical protein